MILDSPSKTNRNVEWAIETFRPLLKALKVQYIGSSPTIVKTSDFRNLIIKGMGRCIIAIQKSNISDGQNGYCVFVHKPELNIYIISMVVNQ